MSNEEQEDEVNLILPYVVSEPDSPQRNKLGKISRLTEAERLRHDAIKILILTLLLIHIHFIRKDM